MPPKGGKADKNAAAASAQASAKASKGAKKKKWSKGKVKEKANNLVVFDEESYDKLYKEAAKYKLVTVSVLSERLRINGSLARVAIRELAAKDQIRCISSHASQAIYTRGSNVAAAE